MPHYVETIVYFQGSNENIQRMLDDLDPQKTGKFTLDKVIAMPAELLDVDSSMVGYVVDGLLSSTDDDLTIESDDNNLHAGEKTKLYKLGITPQTTIGEAKKQIREIPELAEYIALFDKYGACDWYEWAIRNVGTKSFNAEFCISQVEECVCITGDTAWSVPEPIIKELVKRYDLPVHGCAIEQCQLYVSDIDTIDGEVYFIYYENEADMQTVLENHGMGDYFYDDELAD
ncbi:hypothetical protein ACFBZI_11680 [Moraxella sp. ZJ142]|uniref:hypothetical protein n=1 Tax=Moraxella marmotae TaxID=3344520 RepID=UPI0035D3DAA2